MKADLRLDWCSYEAAKYAVEHWHYSKSMPASKTVKIGVWEDGKFIGVIIFSWGANTNIGKPFGLPQTALCERVRIALTKHTTAVSRMVAIAIRMLKKQSPKLRLIVSYADSVQGHIGGIYQAGGWVYVGASVDRHIAINGVVVHKRTVSSLYGTRSIEGVKKRVGSDVKFSNAEPKYKYLYPLDSEMKSQIALLAKPYPKKTCASSVTGSTSENPSESSGSIPTEALPVESSVTVLP